MQENSEKYSLWDLYFSFQLKNVKMLAEKKKPASRQIPLTASHSNDNGIKTNTNKGNTQKKTYKSSGAKISSNKI